jgi:hypothetical protein
MKPSHGHDDADVAVIGAGPAGLTAALAAAERGRRVVVLERMPRPALKLLASGGGRCNLTNTLPADAFMARFGRHGRFMQPALAALDSPALRAMMDRMGVPTHAPDGLHVYPSCERAADVLDALRRRLAALGVTLRTGEEVLRLIVERDPRPGDADRASSSSPRAAASPTPRAGSPDPAREGPVICGVGTSRGPLAARAVVLAAGGRGYADLGGGESGYALAQQAGHTLVPPVPALVPLITLESWPGRCAGVSLAGARVWIDRPGRSRAGVAGDVLFTHRGLSGPAVLDISGDVAAMLACGDPVPLRLRMLPDATIEAWAARFDAWHSGGGATAFRTRLDEFLPRLLAAALCEDVGIGPGARPAHVSREKRRTLAQRIAACPLTVTDTEGWEKAMVTRGGVPLKEVDPRTLASRAAAGLVLAGEILDLDGPCGGFNLQWAFSSGFLAGLTAAGA